MGESCALHQRCFTPSGLHYVSAAHGGWGVVRIAALVPESHQLFVCPFACGRHGALGGAVNGIKDRISYLFITEADIVSGDFEQMIIDGTDELFEALEHKPKVLFIFTSCLDDLLGTDHEPILAELSQRHPDVQFRHCTMNPIKQDTPLPPGVTCNMNMFSLLEKRESTRKMVNVIGSNVSYDDNCDLKQILGKHGYTVSNISDYKTFEDFQIMAEAQLNIVASPIALKAAEMLEKKLGIPYIKSYVNYTPENIADFYKELSDRLGIDLSADTKKYHDEAEEKIGQVYKLVGNYPVAVDYQAVLKPYSLALMLVRHGFNVKMIASDGVAEHEKSALTALAEEAPDIIVENPMSHDAVKFEHEGQKHLCIGFDCGYMTGSDKVVNIMEDEGMFGYYGICRLMDRLADAYNSDTDVNEMIAKAGLII